VSAIEVNDLTKRFGPVTAVDAVSFEVQPGVVTGYLGPNGAGKTTTLRMILGLAHPTSGTATVEGKRYVELHEPTRTVGAVLERSGFHPGRRARDHLRTVARAARLPESRADEVLEAVALTDAGDRRAGQYSLGMRQRLSLATALLGEPRILILDEPANGLDPQGIRWLRDYLRWYAAQGRTVLVSSHVLAEMSQTADAVIVIARGKVVAQGLLEEIVAGASGGAVVVRSPGRQRLADTLREKGLSVETSGDDALVVTGTEAAVVGDLAFRAGVAVHELREREASLEDVFFELTGEESRPS
jgi:ABC-2 type transport system ATP-binding protein